MGVSYGDIVAETATNGNGAGKVAPAPKEAPVATAVAEAHDVLAPLEGKFMLTKDTSETPLKVGDTVKEGDLVCYIESMKTYNAIVADKDGKVVGILKSNRNNFV